MKAWHVRDKHDEWELSDILHAETRGKAKIQSWMYRDYGSEFVDLRAKRIPELDGKELTQKNIQEAGFILMCFKCCGYIYDLNAVFKSNDPYCEDCAELRGLVT